MIGKVAHAMAMGILWSVFTAMGAAAPGNAVDAADFHVAPSGNDTNPGTPAAPLRTIQRAADLAQPGDVVTVHAGVYRERITPPRGGDSDTRRIVYQAAPGAKVEIKGSEIVKNWVKVEGDVWKAILPNTFFGRFNPYSDLIHGDWFNPRGRQHHTGAVYLNGEWLTEAAKLDDVLKPVSATPLWFGQVDQANTTLWAQFNGVNPNEQRVEINVRQTVFYPDKPGINYITVRGFTLRDAATPWAPPTAEQIGLIGTHWSKGWIIENNAVSHSVCSGVSLGKYGDQWDNTSANSAEGYVLTIQRALKNGWNRQTIGHHVVRDNVISHCEQTGVVGSLGAVFSTITGNTIHDIHVRQLFSGAEMAGIKLHAAIDVEISHNHIYRTCRGLWLDWMAQGTRVSANLFHDNKSEDLFVEVDHGPFVVDNNIFLSPTAFLFNSQGGAFVHNLIAGELRVIPYDRRLTPFHKPHSTELAGMHDNPSGDHRFFNNLVVARGDLGQLDATRMPNRMEGNVFLGSGKPSKHEAAPLCKADFDPAIHLFEKSDQWYLEFDFDKAWFEGRPSKRVTTELLGKAAVSNLPYEQPDGTPLRIDSDYFGQRRNSTNPTPGPFERPAAGHVALMVADPHRSGPLPLVATPPGVALRCGGRVVLRYRAEAAPMKPYVQELYTPAGVQILRDSPFDHKHHHGLMFAVAVDGTDFWSEKPTCGRQVPEHAGRLRSWEAGDRSSMADSRFLDWLTSGDVNVLHEQRTITALAGADIPATLLTWRSRLSPPEGKGPAKLTGSHYFGLGMRFVESMDAAGTFFNSERGEGVLVRGSERVTPARWCAYTSQADGKPVTVALFDHPKNARPAYFFTMRPFAYLSATLNLWKQPLEIPPHESLDLRYGVAVWDGQIDSRGVEALYRKWLALEP